MHNEILYILLPDFASHEMVYLMEAISSDESQLKPNPKYVNKIVAPTMEPVTAIGGFRVLPDYSFENMPEDYAAIILIGGYGWLTPASNEVIPIVQKALDNKKLLEQSATAHRLWLKPDSLMVLTILETGLNNSNYGVEIIIPILKATSMSRRYLMAA